MKKTLAKRGGVSPPSTTGKAPSKSWKSRIAEFFRDPEFRLEWDNDIGFHLARNLQELRRYRGLTQAELAERAQTTQPKVALAESGDANLTLKTVARYVEALRGRLRFAIEPEEIETPQLPVWWELAQVLPLERTTWQEHAVFVRGDQKDSVLLAAGWRGEFPQVGHKTIRITTDLEDQTVFRAETLGGPGEIGEHVFDSSSWEEVVT